MMAGHNKRFKSNQIIFLVYGAVKTTINDQVVTDSAETINQMLHVVDC